jgi:hypothetical protein
MILLVTSLGRSIEVMWTIAWGVRTARPNPDDHIGILHITGYKLSSYFIIKVLQIQSLE